jgi:hypothetical protein
MTVARIADAAAIIALLLRFYSASGSGRNGALAVAMRGRPAPAQYPLHLAKIDCNRHSAATKSPPNRHSQRGSTATEVLPNRHRIATARGVLLGPDREAQMPL